MKRLLALVLGLMLLGSAACAAAEGEDRPIVKISVENAGDIWVELRPDAAPATVANFLKLVDGGFYDGLTFHRIISGFMAQGGDPSGNGTGGSPEKIPGEFSANGFENPINHVRGTISMARSSDMNSASSQFFIVHADSPHLDGNYAAFGTVLAGMGVVDRLCQTVRTADNNGTVPPSYQPRITSVTRSTREEAEEAAAAEEANGRGGSAYVEPVTGLRLQLPAGWEKNQRLNMMTAFTNSENGQMIVLSARDFWLYYNGFYGGDTNVSGMQRGDFNTAFLGKESLLGAVGIPDADAFAEEVHGGVTWYVGSLNSQDGTVTRVAIGVGDGIFMTLQGSAESADAMTAMLDGIVAYPAGQTAE